jgi:hypothetical protein
VNKLLLRCLGMLVFVVLTLTVLLSGCFWPGGGYYDGEDFGPGYYEPSGVVYGGWGPGYHVAPFRGGEHQRPTSGGGHASTRAYRSAPASHAMPSIPSKSRSGGGRGGSHGGGGGHR